MPGSVYTAGAMPSQQLSARPRRSGPAGALGVAGLCLVGLALIWVVAELVPAAQLRDALALHDFTVLSRPHVDTVASFLLHLLDPLVFIFWGAALVAFACARERP